MNQCCVYVYEGGGGETRGDGPSVIPGIDLARQFANTLSYLPPLFSVYRQGTGRTGVSTYEKSSKQIMTTKHMYIVQRMFFPFLHYRGHVKMYLPSIFGSTPVLGFLNPRTKVGILALTLGVYELIFIFICHDRRDKKFWDLLGFDLFCLMHFGNGYLWLDFLLGTPCTSMFIGDTPSYAVRVYCMYLCWLDI